MRIPTNNNTEESVINQERLDNVKEAVHHHNIEQSRTRAIDRIKSTIEEATLRNNSTVISESPSSEDLDTFVKWRNQNLNSMSQTCKMLGMFNMQGADEIKNQIKILPKCMVHLTKKMCKCDPKCVSDTFEDFKFDEKCSLFDLDNVYTDEKYIEGCERYDLRPVDGKMVKHRVGKNVDEAKDNFYKVFNELCDDTSKINEIKSSAYELRDECLNSAKCLLNSLNQDVKTDCTNEEYIKQVEEISKIFGIELKTSHQEDLLINQDTQSYGRRLRSIEEIPTISSVLSVEGSNNLQVGEIGTSTEIRDLALNTAAPITVIGIVLISLLGYLSVKNKKDSVKFGCCLSGAVMIMMALIVYFISSGLFN